MKYYVIQQTNAIGNGSSIMVALVIEPRIEGASIHATKVGEIDWNRSTHTNFVFNRIDPVDFIVIGNATCEEHKNPFDED